MVVRIFPTSSFMSWGENIESWVSMGSYLFSCYQWKSCKAGTMHCHRYVWGQESGGWLDKNMDAISQIQWGLSWYKCCQNRVNFSLKNNGSGAERRVEVLSAAANSCIESKRESTAHRQHSGKATSFWQGFKGKAESFWKRFKGKAKSFWQSFNGKAKAKSSLAIAILH